MTLTLLLHRLDLDVVAPTVVGEVTNSRWIGRRRAGGSRHRREGRIIEQGHAAPRGPDPPQQDA